MNIGIDARLWNETGVGRYIRALVRYIGELDKYNSYALFLRKSEYETLQLPKNFRKIEADINWHTLSEQIYLPTIYKNANLDLLHIPYFSVPIFTPLPFIVTIHDLTISHFATGQATTKIYPIYLIKRMGYNVVLKNAIFKSKAIITVSQTVKKEIIHEFNVDPLKITVIYESGILEDQKMNNQINFPKKYILYVGNAHPHKNIKKLLEAFSLLKKNIQDLKLVLIGKKDYFYEELLKFADRNKISDDLILPGTVTNRDLSAWYKKAECYVFPSLSEGFGLPGLEAMLLKCPVAVSNIDVFHEIYGDAALYFDQNSASNIAETVLTIINDSKERQRLIKLGLNKTKQYSWKQMTEETLHLYENCLGI